VDLGTDPCFFKQKKVKYIYCYFCIYFKKCNRFLIFLGHSGLPDSGPGSTFPIESESLSCLDQDPDPQDWFSCLKYVHRSEEMGEAEERCLSLGPDCLAVRHNQARASHFNSQKNTYTVKKVSDFPVPTVPGMSLTKLSLAENNLVTSRLGTGKSLTFFYSV
jgi:hypothetical protein